MSSAPMNSMAVARREKGSAKSMFAVPGFFVRLFCGRGRWRCVGIAHCCTVDLLLQEVVEQRPNRSDCGQLSNIRPGRGNSGAQDIGTQLKFQSQSQPAAQAQANSLDLWFL